MLDYNFHLKQFVRGMSITLPTVADCGMKLSPSICTLVGIKENKRERTTRERESQSRRLVAIPTAAKRLH